ncbi:ArdC family protein [Endozoicomonas sp. 2B-B]
MTKQRRDIHQEVTDRIIKAMESGNLPWVKEWKAGEACSMLPYNASSKKNYSGVNTLLLFIEAEEQGYNANGWVTYKQAQALGGNVRKGEKGCTVVYYNTMKRTVDDVETGEELEVKIPFLKSYTVFNIEQCDGLNLEELKPLEMPEGYDHIDSFVRATSAQIRHGGGKACYSSVLNLIRMPRPEDFTSPEAYYATLFHELTHWTGHKSRLDRQLGNRFGSEAYAAEELIAELGAAFICAQFGICSELRHASYLQSWLKVLKNDKKAIFTAASKASKAAEHLNAYSLEEETERAAA